MSVQSLLLEFNKVIQENIGFSAEKISEIVSSIIERNSSEKELCKSSLEVSIRKNFCSYENQKQILEIALSLSSNDLIDDSLVFILLEDWLEILPVWEISFIFDFLDQNLDLVTKGLQSNKGKGLILLRICNESMKRLNKSQNSMLCGRIMLLLSSVFPSGERSGVNLKGDINVENITTITEFSDSRISKDDYLFYSSFWKLQHFIRHPLEALEQTNWPKVCSSFESLLGAFEKTRHSPASMETEDKYPKFLTDPELFKLQLKDFKFRCVIIIEIAVFLQHLKSLTPKSTNKPPYAKGLTYTLINEEQERWIDSFNRKILTFLSRMHDKSRILYKSLRWILKCEQNWMSWKSESCPALKIKPLDIPKTSFKSLFKTVPSEAELSSAANVVEQEKDHQLFTIKNTLKSHDTKHFLEPLLEQLDPESGVEIEYRLSKNELFHWCILRIIISDPDFAKCATPQGLDAFCSKFVDFDFKLEDPKQMQIDQTPIIKSRHEDNLQTSKDESEAIVISESVHNMQIDDDQ